MTESFTPLIRHALDDALASGNAEALRQLTRAPGGTLDRDRLKQFAEALTYWIDFEMIRRATGVPDYSHAQWVAHQRQISMIGGVRVESRLDLVQAVTDGDITTQQIHQYIMGGGRPSAAVRKAA